MVLVPTHRLPTHPGEMLREEFLKPLKITQEELAELIGMSFQTVNLLVNKHRDVSPNVALRLGRLFGMSPDFWLNLQQRWDLYQERQTSWSEIERKVTPLPKATKHSPEVIEFSDLLRAAQRRASYSITNRAAPKKATRSKPGPRGKNKKPRRRRS